MLLHEIQAKIDLEIVALLTLATERKKEREKNQFKWYVLQKQPKVIHQIRMLIRTMFEWLMN